ncbi:polyribonucleotide nucleotidyltransferase [Patescibacteria group bacterium]|nr:polyribonucleotide nucleotidyltransferase [Patescibacteria group bacterium]MBU1933926.1 polyribonucleotide nucleotidyltransferase [Patescibacteria group bacterium]MBU2233334.1 polyribonucleotide nucleotidyltransferase [Patescibacteria group bacterium]MBU2264491.1 polyribonucleotide nucleotidyltransferase [Patescibacteria group bacterium]
MNNEKVFSCDWLGRTLTIKTGKLARQADAAVTAQYGDTSVLATVVEAKEERDGIDFFPLMVEFEEKLYAAGIIKGSRWIKREGRPSDEAVLTGRMIDRSIRPLFGADSKKDVQVMITVLSADGKNDYDIVSLVAVSAVLSIAGLNWHGPIAGVRVGRVEGQYIFNPTYEERLVSDMDLIVAGANEKVIMIEADGKEIKEADMVEAINMGQKNLQSAINLIGEMKKNVTVTKKPVAKKLVSLEEIEAEKQMEKIFDMAKAWLSKNVRVILFDKTHYTKGERKSAVGNIKQGLDQYLFDQNIDKDKRAAAINHLVDEAVDAEVTRAVLKDKKRVDGRKLDEIRNLSAEVSMLPRIHGSGLFNRGETQVLSIVTLGAPGMEQSLEGLEGVGTKRFMHHYNFAPFSVGEARPIRSTGRREIGHGVLAEKALIPVLPTKEEFPYTVRVVSETLSSNGSSSMAATCGSSLALMDAGVPIKKTVAGIAMGLASNEDMSQWEILTDIQDLEDGQGGMDFKITGTADGITAIQLDTKTHGLTEEMIAKTINQSKKARLEVLEVMNKAIDKPRPDLSPYAPRITSFHIEPDRIREVIGTGGKVINEIIAATGVSIDIDDDGLVMVCGTDAAKVVEAVNWIKNIVRDFEPGEIFKGKVVRLMDFGAFIQLTPNKDGMAHVSELAPYRVGRPSDFIDIGDEVTVKIIEIDDMGRVNLTLNGLVENEHLWKDGKGKQEGDFANPRFNRGDNDRRGGGGRGFRR